MSSVMISLVDLQFCRYPMEPPKLRFLTPIYHPNIDSAGRICLDSLKMPPQGAWKPSLNLSTLLTTVQLLMSEPNPDDPLMTDIVSKTIFCCCRSDHSIERSFMFQATQFSYRKDEFLRCAREWTAKYASSETLSEKKSEDSDSDCSVEIPPSRKKRRTSSDDVTPHPSTSNKKIKL